MRADWAVERREEPRRAGAYLFRRDATVPRVVRGQREGETQEGDARRREGDARRESARGRCQAARGAKGLLGFTF